MSFLWPERPPLDHAAEGPGVDTLPRPGQSPGKPDSTEAETAANQRPDEEQPPRYGNKLV